MAISRGSVSKVLYLKKRDTKYWTTNKWTQYGFSFCISNVFKCISITKYNTSVRLFQSTYRFTHITLNYSHHNTYTCTVQWCKSLSIRKCFVFTVILKSCASQNQNFVNINCQLHVRMSIYNRHKFLHSRIN